MVLNLYLIERPEDEVNHDEMRAVVIAAVTPKHARDLARGVRGDQDSSVWNHGAARLQKLGTAGVRIKQGVVIEDFYEA